MKHVTLSKGKDKPLSRKHRWVFSGAVKSTSEPIEDGELVKVLDSSQNFLALGHWQSSQSINIRIISFDDVNIDVGFWTAIISKALVLRRKLHMDNPSYTDAYRLVHGEGDDIPGLIIDIYGKTAVIQSHSRGVYNMRTDIATAIENVFGEEITTIYSRAKDTIHGDGETVSDEFLKGNTDRQIVVENGIKFAVNWVDGQKTGFFLDQKDNRQALIPYIRDKKVLNCFCYSGGFSMYALAEGAEKVTSVDISSKAMELVEENLTINSFDASKHQSVCQDVMEYLKNEGSHYDVIIVDPPAFAKNIKKRHNAVQAYKRLNSLALKCIKSGGFVFTFSCSQVINEQLFLDTIVAAGLEAGKNVKVVKKLSQSVDHPINLYHPEGHYLKGLILYVE